MPRRGEGGPKLAAMPRIIHTGQALVDATAMVPALPDQGQNVMAQGWSQQAGGAVNILVAAARSGAACVHAGAIGTGPNGDLIREALAQAGGPAVQRLACLHHFHRQRHQRLPAQQGARGLGGVGLDHALAGLAVGLQGFEDVGGHGA